MGKELSDAEFLRDFIRHHEEFEAIVSQKPHAPGHEYKRPEWLDRLRSIADRLERPGVDEIRLRRGDLHIVEKNGAKVIHNESGCPLNHKEIESLPFDGNSELFDVEIVLRRYPRLRPAIWTEEMFAELESTPKLPPRPDNPAKGLR